MGRDPILSRQFAFCFLGSFLQSLAFNLFLHLPGFIKELGAREVEIGLIFSVTAVAAIAVRPSIGRVMDRRGRRPVILLGGLLNTMVCGLYLTISEIGVWIVVVRVIHGLSEAMLFSAFFTYAADIVPARRRTEGIALFGVSGILPIALGGVLGDWILAQAGYDEMFRVAVVLAAASVLVSFPMAESYVRPVDGETPRGFGAAVVQPSLLPLWFLGAVFATALASAFTFMKTFVMETGIGSMGLFFSAYAFAAVVLRIFFAWIPDRVGPKRALFPALGCLCLGFFALALATDAKDLAIAGILCGLGHGFTFPIVSGMVVTRAREEERGAAMSVFTALFDAGVLVGGPAFGAVIGVWGYSTMFACAGGVVALGAVVFGFWDRGR